MNVAHFSRKEPNLEQDSRLEQLQAWLKIIAREKVGDPPFSVPESASADASFRRYFRVRRGDERFIVMDAPPQHEDCEPFVRISGWLAQMGLHVPQVLAWDRENGFLLLTDLGTIDYQTALNDATADALYADALDALVTLQTRGDAYLSQLPPYDARLLHEEMELFSDWLITRYLGLEMPPAWTETVQALVESAQAQPAVFGHRDYHSRNLMVTDPNPGILDFQDAVAGPLTYDAVSLLRDCYVRWPEEKVAQWRDAYFDRLVDAGLQQRNDHVPFVRAFDLMGVQRHLKAAGIFARLWLRDGKARYLDDIPNTLRYIAEVGRNYRETNALAEWVESVVLPAFEEAPRA
ncbi:hypothetical protein SAMN05443662_1199 [Sulfurivirga caldicuralii]|uniref:Aminoglycoside phosphotransferase domain-containing protein n=1 Tax=Sulfurivirga caldicuralii TaxID=364032 RepID=A0A1N6G5H1_9GAMM|nr:phosphotransferase [Sulfurivirga caldicuralii]SIO02744.1 hypothetical protein SAMN05443662_1199 [Sulfurivirga caldicuralii]